MVLSNNPTPRNSLNNLLRLNKFLASKLSIGRREGDSLILDGKVSVNGQKATIGMKLEMGDSVKVNGHTFVRADNDTNYSYLLLNKPEGYICSTKQQGTSPTIYKLLPKTYRHLKPVGRLDKDSSGLLLLTNDGDFAQVMTHPNYSKKKVYEVTLNKPMKEADLNIITESGVLLDDGKPSRLGMKRISDDGDTWLVTLTEGRNRQIRKTLSGLDYTVTRLHRISFGPYRLSDIKSGQMVETKRMSV